MRWTFGGGVRLVALSLVMVGTSLAADAVVSGLKPGQYAGPFDVDDITGPAQGKTLCYR